MNLPVAWLIVGCC